MTDAPQGPQPKPGILDIAPYVGGKSSIVGVAEPMKLSSNENMLGSGEKARAAYEAAVRNIHVYPDGRATKLRTAVASLKRTSAFAGCTFTSKSALGKVINRTAIGCRPRGRVSPYPALIAPSKRRSCTGRPFTNKNTCAVVGRFIVGKPANPVRQI